MFVQLLQFLVYASKCLAQMKSVLKRYKILLLIVKLAFVFYSLLLRVADLRRHLRLISMK